MLHEQTPKIGHRKVDTNQRANMLTDLGTFL